MINKLTQLPRYRQFGGCYLFDFNRGFFENGMCKSRVRYNPSTGVCDIYINFRTYEPKNPNASTYSIQYALKQLLGAGKFICNVSKSQKVRNREYYMVTVEFYFKTNKIPEPSVLDQVPETIESNLIPYEFERTDPKTGEKEYLTFQELPEGTVRYLIVRDCEEWDLSKTERKSRHCGYQWAFA